ncbi:DNA alkylation repair protein [Salmonirosea aquatica]|uniref:DNA alkylation repair protein n=1 Tax=Salmonirosea aquatica TaxID=2654236 RepID=A0A7C9BC51_9BACT|nr:DNA alkylation repair protein [Cytophagaceae bacterium SJW1-29]
MENIRAALAQLADESRAVQVARFFQTGPGQYAEGDVFWGISNPEVRKVARQWQHLEFEAVENLLRDPVHECRFAALLIWVRQYPKASEAQRQAIFESYLAHLEYINNWDLVDLSARDIVGRHLFDKDRSVLYDLAQRSHLWSQRVSLIATFYFIRKNQFADFLALAELLLSHEHHLIHKAIGWMLRETGKRDLDVMEEFLHRHIERLPRTSLRYAIEHLPPFRRQYYLSLR